MPTKSKTARPTPAEWYYHEGTPPHDQAQIYGEDGKTLAITYNDEGGKRAAAIVRDHNAGAGLVAALELADKVAEESDKMVAGEVNHDPDCPVCKAVDAYRKARAALAKAGL